MKFNSLLATSIVNFLKRMANLIFHSELRHKDGKLVVQLELLSFKEDNIYVIYAPALDISAFGETEEKAKDDFGEVMGSYLEYCLNKNTLLADLKAHGWTIRSKKRIKAPSEEVLTRINSTYKEIKENKEYKTIQREMVIPAI